MRACVAGIAHQKTKCYEKTTFSSSSTFEGMFPFYKQSISYTAMRPLSYEEISQIRHLLTLFVILTEPKFPNLPRSHSQRYTFDCRNGQSCVYHRCQQCWFHHEQELPLTTPPSPLSLYGPSAELEECLSPPARCPTAYNQCRQVPTSTSEDHVNPGIQKISAYHHHYFNVAVNT